MYFLDVKESYFQGYHDALDPVFKDPKGRICNYTEMKKKFMYTEPFYDDSAHQQLDIDAKKFLFSSQADWNNVKRQLQSIDRVGVRVSVEN